MKKLIFLILPVFLISTVVFSQVVEVNMGKVKKVEFIGLEKWTPQMVLDTLASSSDSVCFVNNAFRIYCNSCLEDNLPFPSVFASTYIKDNGTLFVTISVVEPQYKDLISYINLPSKMLPDRKEWKPLIKLCSQDNYIYQLAFPMYATFLKNNQSQIDSTLANLSDNYGIDTTSFHQYWNTLKKYRDIKNFNDAIETLENDKNTNNRIAAVSILLNFGANQKTYFTLINLLRIKSDNRVSNFASTVLTSLAKSGIPRIDLENMKESLAALLNGTNLQYFIPLMKFLSSMSNLTNSQQTMILKLCRRLSIAYLKSETYKKIIKKDIESITERKFENCNECISYLNSF